MSNKAWHVVLWIPEVVSIHKHPGTATVVSILNQVTVNYTYPA